LFMCSSGAEANENALKLASFYNKKAKVVAFKNAFHGRTSAAVAATDTPKIIAPLNAQQEVIFLAFGDEKALEETLSKEDVCAVIIEAIQGVGGLDMPTKKFMKGVEKLCRKYNSCLIADEVQSGFGRSGAFFAYQHFGVTPDIISMAKGMGNGFPVGGIFVHPKIEPWYGMLGTTFGGNHLACQASLAVLEVLKKKNLISHAASLGEAFEARAKTIKAVKKVKGRGLMLGLEFDFEVSELRKKLIYEHRVFTGGSSNKKLLRILPPLTIQQKHFDYFFNALEKSL
jgi:acetylornithine/N-succinyldiaminopimelate aminotransferase